MAIGTDAQIYTGHLPNTNRKLQRVTQVAHERNKRRNKGKGILRTGPTMVQLVEALCHKNRSCVFDSW